MSDTKTIAAISTALSPAGISVIRVSGENAIHIAEKVFRGQKKLSEMPGYTCAFGEIVDENEKLDEAVATVFKAPKSYTGEDVVELSCHGGVSVTKEILKTLFQNGASPAEPGEFTKRAYLNGKLDLAEAESVMDLISARSRTSARAALAVKEGALSKKINAVKAELLTLVSHLNAWADYPEEEIPALESGEIEATLDGCIASLSAILRGFDNGKILKDGIDAVIVGKPNVGKSTLMNLLSGYEKSIVTDIAGTTRDVVEESVNLDGVTLNLSDTAGIRAASDEIEKIGVDKARKKLCAAALAICVFDASSALTAEDEEILNTLEAIPTIAVINKTDLEKKLDETMIREKIENVVTMSSKTGEGFERFSALIKALCLSEDFDFSGAFTYNERQRSLTEKARDSLVEAKAALSVGLDAVTVSAEEAIAFLCELTGENVTEEVIDRVFHNFCVGK